MNNTLPSSTLTLFKVVCDPTYQNVWGFRSKSALDDYLNSMPNHTFIDGSGNPNYLYYIRRNSTIDIPMLFDDCEQYTYCRYNNDENSGDEYAFIIDKQFINMNCTRLVLQYDTWINYRVLSRFNMDNVHGLVERKLTYGLNYLADNSSDLDTLISESTIYNNDFIMVYITYDPINFQLTTTTNYNKIITEDNVGGAVFFFDSSNYDKLRIFLMDMSSNTYVYSIYISSISTTGKNAIESNSETASYTIQFSPSAGVIINGRLPNYSRNRFNSSNAISWTDYHNITIPYNSLNKKMLTYPYTKIQMNMFGNDYPLDITLLPFESQDETSYTAKLDIRNSIYFSSNDLVISSEITMKDGKMKIYNSIGTISKTEDRSWNALNATLSTLLDVPTQASSSVISTMETRYNHPKRKVAPTSAFDLLSESVNVVGAGMTNAITALVQPDKPVYGTTNALNKLKCGGNGNIIIRCYMPIDSEIKRIEDMWNMYGYPCYIYDMHLSNYAYYDYIKYVNVTIQLNNMCLDEQVKLRQILRNGICVYYSPNDYNFGSIPSAEINIGG